MRLDSPLLSIALGLLACGASDAGAFRFDSSSSPINGQSAGDVIDEDGLTMSVATVSDGATFWTEPSGMGIDSRGVAGATDGEPDKFNLPGGALDGQTEAIVSTAARHNTTIRRRSNHSATREDRDAE